MTLSRSKRMSLAAALLLAPAAAFAQAGGRESDNKDARQERESQIQRQRGWTGQRSVDGEPASRSGHSGPPSPGLETGAADGLAGGRTDRGPKGTTGMAETHDDGTATRKRANQANQRRGRAKPDLTRPAQSKADRARGSGEGARRTSRDDRAPLKEEGARIPDESGGKKASDVTANTEQPGGSRPDGPTRHDDSPNRGEGPAPTPKPRNK